MMRWRYGAENRIYTIAGTDITIGDLCYRYGRVVPVYPADDPTYKWVKRFLGIAMTAGHRAQTVQVATTGVFEFPIDGYAQVGDFVTAAYQYTGNPEMVTVNPQLLTVCSEEYAVGQVVKEPYYSDDRYFGKRELCVLIELRSRLCTST
jgi:hypothetical protein